MPLVTPELCKIQCFLPQDAIQFPHNQTLEMCFMSSQSIQMVMEIQHVWFLKISVWGVKGSRYGIYSFVWLFSFLYFSSSGILFSFHSLPKISIQRRESQRHVGDALGKSFCACSFTEFCVVRWLYFQEALAQEFKPGTESPKPLLTSSALLFLKSLGLPSKCSFLASIFLKRHVFNIVHKSQLHLVNY